MREEEVVRGEEGTSTISHRIYRGKIVDEVIISTVTVRYMFMFERGTIKKEDNRMDREIGNLCILFKDSINMNSRYEPLIPLWTVRRI